MAIFHIFRNSSEESLFKDIIQASIEFCVGNKIYISSGFIQEDYPDSRPYSCFNDSSTYGLSFCNNPGMRQIEMIQICGVHNYSWKEQYFRFCHKIRYSYPNIRIIQFIRNRTHAKIFVLCKDDIPFIEIIGSSNLTRPAYGTDKTFNYEADLVMINDEHPDFKPFQDKIITTFKNRKHSRYVKFDFAKQDDEKNLTQVMKETIEQYFRK